MFIQILPLVEHATILLRICSWWGSLPWEVERPLCTCGSCFKKLQISLNKISYHIFIFVRGNYKSIILACRKLCLQCHHYQYVYGRRVQTCPKYFPPCRQHPNPLLFDRLQLLHPKQNPREKCHRVRALRDYNRQLKYIILQKLWSFLCKFEYITWLY